MILSDFTIPSQINQRWQYTGIDSPEHCLDKKHFQSYPYVFEYCYNSRGYRDQEWPTELSELETAIWCVGDSFTAGVGSPVEHTWPYILQQQTGRQTINVSMDGASNQWMARKIKRIVEVIAPKTIIVQWSYFSRRELESGFDDQRRMQYDPGQLDDEQNIENFKNCVLETKDICKDCQLINSIIPNAFSGIDPIEVNGWWNNDKESSWPEQLPTELPRDILDKLQKKQQHNKYIIHYTLQEFIKNNNMILVDQYDEFFNKELARDGHHYDIATATKFVNRLQVNLI